MHICNTGELKTFGEREEKKITFRLGSAVSLFVNKGIKIHLPDRSKMIMVLNARNLF